MPAKKRSGKTLGQGKYGSVTDLTLPSGETCSARRPGVQGLIAAGLLDNFDQLTALVQTEHIEKHSNRPVAAREQLTDAERVQAGLALIKDQDKLHAGFMLIDKLVAFIVTEPRVWIDYQTKDEDDEAFQRRLELAEASGAIGVRDIDLNDKVYLVNWAVGGSSDLESFRQGLQSGMAPMAAM